MTHSLRASPLLWLASAILLATASAASAETYVVTSTADDGAVGTLRWAIEQANTTTTQDTILIAVGSDQTITLKNVVDETPLPPLDITEPVIIDSSASPGLTVTRGSASESFKVAAATTWTNLHLASEGGFLLNESITFDQATLAGEISSAIEGSGSLIKTGAETLTLSGNNSYGGTTINEGELIVTADSLGDGAVTLADDTILTFNETGSGTFTYDITGTGKVVKDGSGTVTLKQFADKYNQWSGDTEVKDGTLVSKGKVGGGIPQDSDVSVSSSTATFEFEIELCDTPPCAPVEYGGVISGLGSFTKSGLGELELRADNLYTGGTRIEEGSLLITTVSRLPASGGVAISSGASLTLDGFDALPQETLGLPLSGAGGLIVIGGFEVLLAGNNSFSGGILVEDGTVTGTTSSIPGDVDLDSSGDDLIFDQDFDGTHAGEIIGYGSVVKRGTGTVKLTGTNDFELPAVVIEGVLAVTTLSLPPANGLSLELCSFEPSGLTGYSACVESGATLRFDQDFDGDFDGLIVSAILNGGDVEKSGSGSVTITANQEYTGDTRVTGGELVIEADLDSSNVVVSGTGTLRLADKLESNIKGGVDVNLGGTLSGIGSIQGNVWVRNGGTVAPNNVADMAPLTLQADITFETGSTFAVSVNADNKADKLAVKTVTVGSGVTLEVSLADGNYSSGSRATVLSSEENRTGDFDFISDDYAFLLVTVDQASSRNIDIDVKLDTTVDIASFAQTGNEAAVAGALAAASVIGSGSALDQALQPLTVAEVPAALEQLAGIPLTSSFTVRRAESLAFRRGLASRIRDYADRGGPARTFEAEPEGFAPPARQYRHRRFFAPSHGEHSWNGSGRSASPPAATGPGAWVGAYGSFGEMEDSVDAPGFDYDFYGGAAGADFRMTDSLLLGASVAYAHAKLDGYDRIAASGSGDSVRGALYGAYAHPELGAYVGLQLGYAWSDFEDHRWIRFGGLDSRASASVTGNEFSGYAEIGPRAFTFGEVRLRPFMGIGYAWFDSESFTESGAPAGANLSVDSGSYQSLELGPGLLADQVIDLGPGFKLRAELRARYTHEFLDTNPKLDASISGSAFEVQGKSPGRHVGLLGASLEFIDHGGVTTYLSYDFRGNTDMLEHTASAGIQVRF